MKKSVAIILMLSMMLWVMPLMGFSEEQSSGLLNLEKAIVTAKKFFAIPEGLDQFDSSFEQSGDLNAWSLRWYSSKGKGEVNVRIDALSGEVAGYNHYNPKDNDDSVQLPKISKTEGEQIALGFIKKVAPSKANEVILKPDNFSNNRGTTLYYYYFSRVINGIEYPNNNINVEVNSKTGEIRNFNVIWENINVSPVQAKLSQEDAQKIFNEKLGFELKYFKPQSYGQKNDKPVKVVYEINNPYQVVIDAITGDIIQEEYYGSSYDKGGARGESRSNAKEKLTPEEQKIADEVKGLISKEDALAIAEKTLKLTDKYTLNNANLSRDGEFPELMIWNFGWNYQDKDRSYWANAEVDAKSGKVVAFDYSDELNDPKGKEQRPLIIKKKDEAEKIVQNYLQANYPETVKNLRPQPEPIIRPLRDSEDKDQPSYFFQYERLVNGIPFGQNFVNATVNCYTGKINSFRIRFVDQNFPKTDNVLDKAKFTAEYLAKQPLCLVYTKDKDKKLQLVYKLAPAESYRFDAVNGQMIGWDGNPVKDNKTGEIGDIKGHWAENDINILNELGYLRLENGKFNPDTDLNQANMIRILVKIGHYYIDDSTEGNWYEPYYEQAMQSGIIKENEIKPSAVITREEIAKYLVRSMMWDKVATMDIYKKLNYKDAHNISKGYNGYVAILSGLGVMNGNDGYWSPKEKVKKGEACAVFVRYMKIGKGNY